MVDDDLNSVGVPSVKGMKSAFTDYAIGAGGGLVYAIGRAIFGSGLLGSLVAPVLAGSVVKGERGTALATVAGFMAFGGGASNNTASTATASTSSVNNQVE